MPWGRGLFCPHCSGMGRACVKRYELGKAREKCCLSEVQQDLLLARPVIHQACGHCGLNRNTWRVDFLPGASKRAQPEEPLCQLGDQRLTVG